MSSENLGPLRNGNPRGDPRTSPRCGAHTRAGCPCCQPAMPNGRCPPGQARGQAQHGGRSTGPRTDAGRAVLAAAQTKHGHYGTEARAFSAAIDILLRGAPNQPGGSRGTA